MAEKGVNASAALSEAWKQQHQKHLGVTFRRDEPGDYDLYAWIQNVASNTGMTPSAIVKVALRAGKTTACKKAEEYSQSVKKARAKLNE